MSLTPPILCPIMHPIQDSSEWRYVVEKSIKMFDRILVGQIQPELAQNLLMHVSVGNIGNVCIDHQRKQVENQVRALAKDDESCETEILEAAVVDGLSPAHGVNHLFADLHWRGKNFRVPTEYIPEIN